SLTFYKRLQTSYWYNCNVPYIEQCSGSIIQCHYYLVMSAYGFNGILETPSKCKPVVYKYPSCSKQVVDEWNNSPESSTIALSNITSSVIWRLIPLIFVNGTNASGSDAIIRLRNGYGCKASNIDDRITEHATKYPFNLLNR